MNLFALRWRWHQQPREPDWLVSYIGQFGKPICLQSRGILDSPKIAESLIDNSGGTACQISPFRDDHRKPEKMTR